MFRRPVTCGGLAVALLLGSLLAPAAAADDPTASVDANLLERLDERDEARFWVELTADANLAAAAAAGDWTARGEYVVEQLTSTADQSQHSIRSLLAARDVDFTSFWIVNAILVTGGKSLVDELAARPEVAQIRLEHTFELPEAPTPDDAGIAAVEWGVDRIGADDVWTTFGVRGEDIVVGSIDTGVQYDHPALVDQYRGNRGDGTFDHNYNWWDPSEVCGSPSLEPCDNHGHGTHTTGTMVGDDGASNQIGVAPGARWIAAKGCETNRCSESALVSAGQWMLAPNDLTGANPDPSKRPHIINNSWGGDDGAETFYQPIVQAWVEIGAR